MEKILVAMNSAKTNFCAAIHALNLARRINARVSFLLVFPRPSKGMQKSFGKEMEISVKKRLESLIEEGRSEGLTVDYYQAHGDYENELVDFVQDNRTTLLVVELPSEQAALSETSRDFLDRLRHRISCRIEVVHEKTNQPERKGENRVAPVSTDRGK